MVPTRNQFNTVSPLHSLMDEFLGEVTGNTRTVARQFRPAMDLKEDQGNFYALLELPGMEKEDVKIALDEDILTIKGEKKHEVEENEGAFKRIESSYGSFDRSVHLPREIIATDISAEMKNGVLEITIPKSEAIEAQQITIN